MILKLKVKSFIKTAITIVFVLVLGLFTVSQSNIKVKNAILSVFAMNQSESKVISLKENLVSVINRDNRKDNNKEIKMPLIVSKDKLNEIKNINELIKEKNGKSYLETTPNDTFYANTSNYYALPGILLDSWNLRDIGFLPTDEVPLSGWDLSTGVNNTIVATIDTGIDLTHPELSDNLWVNAGEIAGNGLDDDANGFIDDVNGYNFADSYDYNADGDFLDANDIKNPNITDLDGHGTHVAGVIGAKTNNSLGVAGVCQTCKVMALKVVNSYGFAFDSDVAYAIIYASEMGAKVINISLGGGGYSESIDIASSYAYLTNGTLIVGASGNDSIDSSDSFPGAALYGVNVGSSNSDPVNPLSNFSNFGQRMDILAPGGQLNDGTQREAIVSTYTGSQYALMKGTSMASPHVAGVAGLLYDLNPTWDVSEVRYALLSGATDIDSVPNGYAVGFDSKSGFGKLNSISSLSKLDGDVAFIAGDVTSPAISINAPGSLNVRGTLNITGTVSDTNLYMYTVYFERTSDSYIVSQRSGRSSVTDNTLLSFDTSNISDGEYLIYARAEDYSGNDTLSSSVTITIDNTPPTTVNLSYPGSSVFINSANPLLSWSASTDTHGPVLYDIYVNSTFITGGYSGTTLQSVANFANGSSNSWYVIATDTFGNISQSVTNQFSVDLTFPVITNVNAVVNSSGVSITFNVSSPTSGIGSYQMSLNSGAFSSFTPPYTNNSLSDGTYNFDLRVYNNAGSYYDALGSFVINNRRFYLLSKADYTLNGKVDLSDLSILAQYWGTNSSLADSNFDGKVDLSDLSILASNWNQNF